MPPTQIAVRNSTAVEMRQSYIDRIKTAMFDAIKDWQYPDRDRKVFTDLRSGRRKKSSKFEIVDIVYILSANLFVTYDGRFIREERIAPDSESTATCFYFIDLESLSQDALHSAVQGILNPGRYAYKGNSEVVMKQMRRYLLAFERQDPQTVQSVPPISDKEELELQRKKAVDRLRSKEILHLDRLLEITKRRLKRRIPGYLRKAARRAKRSYIRTGRYNGEYAVVYDEPGLLQSMFGYPIFPEPSEFFADSSRQRQLRQNEAYAYALALVKETPNPGITGSLVDFYYDLSGCVLIFNIREQ